MFSQPKSKGGGCGECWWELLFKPGDGTEGNFVRVTGWFTLGVLREGEISERMMEVFP